MGEYQIFGAFLVASCLVAAGAAWWLARRRTGWSARQVCMIAALPLPGSAAVLFLLLIVRAGFDAVTGSRACGLNACALTMSTNFVLLLQALAIYGIALVPAFLAVRLAR